MPFQSERARLVLSGLEQEELTEISRARGAPLVRVQRAQMMLAYASGETISSIARRLHTNRPKVERCVDKALQLGVKAAMKDLPRSGRTARITPEARTWVVDLACQKPKDLGYSYEIWTTELLARHVRRHCESAGHPCLLKLARGTVSKMLRSGQIRPHKMTYYLQRRDPDFEAKMAQVLCVYKEVHCCPSVSEASSVTNFQQRTCGTKRENR